MITSDSNITILKLANMNIKSINRVYVDIYHTHVDMQEVDRWSPGSKQRPGVLVHLNILLDRDVKCPIQIGPDSPQMGLFKILSYTSDGYS